jgi:hypothetical protein
VRLPEPAGRFTRAQVVRIDALPEIVGGRDRIAGFV